MRQGFFFLVCTAWGFLCHLLIPQEIIVTIIQVNAVPDEKSKFRVKLESLNLLNFLNCIKNSDVNNA